MTKWYELRYIPDGNYAGRCFASNAKAAIKKMQKILKTVEDLSAKRVK